GIQSVIRRKRKKHKKSTPQHVAENLMNREFSASRPDEKWCTDVTEFKYGAVKNAYFHILPKCHHFLFFLWGSSFILSIS
ncbi:hypothetical protein ACJBPP_11215, partial [Streptococcus suis]